MVECTALALPSADGVGTRIGLQLVDALRLPYVLVGVGLLVVAFVDVIWTTLWTDGGSGPLSSRLATWSWRGLRTVSERRSRVLSLAGPLILVLTLVVWVGLIWGGWTLLFAGAEDAIVDTQDRGPVGWTDRVYFVAYAMFTMGNGDFAPAEGFWQIATALTTASGMFSVTLAVTYVLSVLGAVVDKRSFASSVTGVGDRSESFVRTGWSDDDFRTLDPLLDTFASDLARLAKQHNAYPILHYYHSETGADSSAMAVAVFDEALTLLRFGVHDDGLTNDALVRTGRSSVENYLRSLDTASIPTARDAPPPPELRRLREADIPTVSDEEFAESLDALAERRRTLLGVVNADAWHWPPVDDE